MRRWGIWLAVVVVFPTAGVLPAQAPAPAPGLNVILIGWDGAQREHVKECLARQELPALQRLIRQGTFVDIEVTTGATDTKAGWTQILTGYRPAVTGVYSNSRYQPIPVGYTIFERLRSHFGPDRIATVAIIGKAKHVGEIDPPARQRVEGVREEAAVATQASRPGRPGRAAGGPAQPKGPTGRIVVEDGVAYRLVPGSPYYHTHQNVDVWLYGLMLDEKVGARTLELLEKYKDKPFFFFVHFAEVDHSGHQYGENSPQYNAALVSNDTWTGRIMDKLQELKLDDRTLLYVTADHGFDEGQRSHRKAPHVFLATNDKQVRRGGDRADIAPTILERFGVDLARLQPPLDGRPLTRP